MRAQRWWAILAGVALVTGLGVTGIGTVVGAVDGSSTTVSPDEVTADVLAGSSVEITKTVQTPEVPATLDVYFLADTTGSMGGYLTAAHVSAEEMIATISAQAIDSRFGAGQYRDFASDQPSKVCNFAFSNQATMLPDGGAGALAAINAWSAASGCDAPESQLFAFDRLGDPSDPAGFRPGATKVVVWFGDNPGHDPVCSAISGLDHDVTEASATAALQSAGIRVLAVSIGGGLDRDPTVGSDYVSDCGAPGGTAGQASRIAAATGGQYTTIDDPAQLVPAILAMIRSVPITVSLAAECPAPLSVSFSPASITVPAGEVATFTETFAVDPRAGLSTVECSVAVSLDGKVVDGVTERNVFTVRPAPRFTG